MRDGVQVQGSQAQVQGMTQFPWRQAGSGARFGLASGTGSGESGTKWFCANCGRAENLWKYNNCRTVEGRGGFLLLEFRDLWGKGVLGALIFVCLLVSLRFRFWILFRLVCQQVPAVCVPAI